MNEAPAPRVRPALSVIVPTRNRSRWLLRLLERLNEQTYPAERFEVVPVVNGSTDDTIERLARFEAPFALHPIETAEPGTARARNRGASAAKGDLLLFLDDDVVPAPALVEAHARAHETEERFVGVGPYYPVHAPRVDFLRISTRNWWENLFEEIRRPGHRSCYRDVLSGNLSIRRDLFRSLGGFARDFAECDGEDWELGIRVVRNGIPIRFLPDAEAEHHEHETMTLERSFLRARRAGRGDARVSLHHPEFRRKLAPPPGRPWDLSPRRAPILLARCAPRVCEGPARALARLLPLFESARMRKGWKCLYHFIRGYWHWRGYFEEMRKIGFERGFPGPQPEPAEEAAVSLDVGIEEAARLVDRERPAALRVFSEDRLVGVVPFEPGAERLRGIHLRRALAGPLSEAFMADRGGREWSR
ncbi:MAG: glycosyltransferase [Candidatus Eisenbacteria bacterium]